MNESTLFDSFCIDVVIFTTVEISLYLVMLVFAYDADMTSLIGTSSEKDLYRDSTHETHVVKNAMRGQHLLYLGRPWKSLATPEKSCFLMKNSAKQ